MKDNIKNLTPSPSPQGEGSKDIENLTPKRRNFLQISMIGGVAAFLSGIIPFGLGKTKEKSVFNTDDESKPIEVKIHPLAVKRNIGS